jgi:hypothetical protein
MCTSNADCCPGIPCVIQPGQTSGLCGGPSDGGTPTDGGTTTPDGGDAGACTLYGQICTMSSECCALGTTAVPCIGGRCRFP